MKSHKARKRRKLCEFMETVITQNGKWKSGKVHLRSFRVKGYPLMPRFTYKIDIESNIESGNHTFTYT